MIYFYILRKIIVWHAYSFEIKAQHNYSLFLRYREGEILYEINKYRLLLV